MPLPHQQHRYRLAISLAIGVQIWSSVTLIWQSGHRTYENIWSPKVHTVDEFSATLPLVDVSLRTFRGWRHHVHRDVGAALHQPAQRHAVGVALETRDVVHDPPQRQRLVLERVVTSRRGVVRQKPWQRGENGDVTRERSRVYGSSVSPTPLLQ